MDGVITAYSGTSMTVLVDGTAGSGTYTAWFVTLTGSVGGVTSFSGNSTGLTPSTPTAGAISLAGTLVAVNGGTGQASYAVGDLLYASTTTALSKLADVATGNALISGGVGVAPAYGKIGLTTHVSGTLPVANGGTNSTATPTAGGVAYGTGTAYAVNTAGTSGQVLTSAGAGAPTWTTPTTGTVTSVTGTAPVVSSGGSTPAISMAAATALVSGYLTSTDWATFNGKGVGTVTSVGGTGTVNGITLTGTVTSSGSLTLGGTLSGVSLTSQVSGTLPVANGGTGATTLTGVVIGNGTSAFTVKTNPTGDFVGTTDTQTLTNKTLTSYTETVFAVVDAAGAVLDPNNGSIQTRTLGASRTPTQANWAAGQSITLMIDDGTAYTVTWTTLGVVWETNGGVAPTLATTGYTVIVLWKVGTTIYGARVGDA